MKMLIKNGVLPRSVCSHGRFVKYAPRTPNVRLVGSSRKKHIVPRAVTWVDSVEWGSYFVGKGIILFTMFYCSLNWLHYRNLRKSLEEEDASGKDKEGGKDDR